MTLYQNRYRIESTRLSGYDYVTPGWYFITICTQKRTRMFGAVRNGKMITNSYGEIVRTCWTDLPNHYHNIQLDEFIIMPDHIHGIIQITPAALSSSKPYSLSEIVRGFKTFSARRINEYRNVKGMPIWQERFYDRIIVDDNAILKIRRYIQNNPIHLWDDR